MIDRLDIHAYADRELPPEESSRLEREIGASPEAARELEAIQSLKGCLQTKMSAPESGDAWKMCRGRLDELDRVKKTEFIVGKYAWALSALLFLVILGGGLFNHYRGGSVSVGRLASDISGMTPMQMPKMSQPEQLRSFISDQTGQSATVQINPSRVVAVAFVDLPQGRVLRFTKQDQEGFYDIVLIPNVAGVEGVQPIGDGLYAGQLNGRNCVIRPDSGCVVLVIGDRDTGELRNITQSLYR